MTSRNRAPARRMQWGVVSSGTPVTVAAGAIVRVDMTSVLEADMGRTLGNYTIIRMVGQLAVKGEGINVLTQWTAGVIQLADQVLITQMPSPQLQNSADWLWLRRGYCDAVALPAQYVNIDNRTARKTAELNRNWFFVITNTSGVQDLTFGIFLRILLKFA